MRSVEDFIYGLDGQQKAIVSCLCDHLTEQHNLFSKINWNIPTFYKKNWICYLNPIKNEGIELAFFKGFELSNVQGVLKSKGRKLVHGIDFYSTNAIHLPTINEIVQEAILLDHLSKK